MPREKILFDKKKLFELFDKANLGFFEKGIFLDLTQFMFTDNHYHLLLNKGTGEIFTPRTLHEYLIKQGASQTQAESAANNLIKYNLIDTNIKGEVYCPMLYHQHEVSKAKRRETKKITLPIESEPQPQEKHPVEIKPEKANDDIQSLKMHLFGEQKEAQDIKQQAAELLRYLNEKAQKIKGFTPTPANLGPIIARLKEGYSVEDCKKVIDYMCLKWKETPQETYLRPITLFKASKFETYLNEALKHFNERKEEKIHSLNVFIDKYFPRVKKIRVQMSFEECQKIGKICPDKETIKKQLLSMENDPKLFDYNNSVYLALKQKLERYLSSNGHTTLKSGVKKNVNNNYG